MSEPLGMRTAWCGELRSSDAGRTVRLCGWVDRRREHGEHLAFVDLRDHTGIVQCVVDGAQDLRSEYVAAIEGTVRVRPDGTANDAMPTGEVEVGDCSIELLADAQTPPIPIGDRAEADETARLRYRYLDLRRPRMQQSLRLRSRVNAALRAAMDRQGFVEVETPFLWTPTPEGSREFAVPSRLQPGSFYVLPQSPQIAKQLLMVGGVDRYYQIARCMRDEDLRADRQWEFTQLDLEASFVGPGEVTEFVSEAVRDAAEVATGERPPPISAISWREALDRFGTEKPDLRFGMELIDIRPAVESTDFRAFQTPCVRALRWEGQAGATRARLDRCRDRAVELGAAGLVWFRVVPDGDGVTLDSPVARFLGEAERSAILEVTGAAAGDVLLVVAGDWRRTCEVLGQLRNELARPPVSEGPMHYVWVVDFPLFEGLDDAGRPVPAHHPFTMPHPEDLSRLETDPLSVRSQAYDLVLNGWELGSGSIRVHRADIQARVFAALGIGEEEASDRFGFLLGAFRFGAPPHGGFALGIDRLVAIFAGQDNIREVIAFPKTQSGSDPMTGAPKPLPAASLVELGLSVLPARK